MDKKLSNQSVKPIGKDMGWLDAREAVKDKGGLPSNILHDHYLVETEEYKKLPFTYYGAWSSDVAIYPEANGVFSKNGKEHIDAYTDDKGRQWIYLTKDIPKQALNKKGMALVIRNPKVQVTDKKVIISPGKVFVVKDWLQSDGWGKVDMATRVPTQVSESQLNALPDNQKRYLYRIGGKGVRPLARYYNDFDFRRDVDAYWRRDDWFGVAGVEGGNFKPSKNETFIEKKVKKETINFELFRLAFGICLFASFLLFFSLHHLGGIILYISSLSMTICTAVIFFESRRIAELCMALGLVILMEAYFLAKLYLLLANLFAIAILYLAKAFIFLISGFDSKNLLTTIETQTYSEKARQVWNSIKGWDN